MSHSRPLDGRNEAIAERFAAGDTLATLAWDYDLPPTQIAQICLDYSLQRDPGRHHRLLQHGPALSASQLRAHLQDLCHAEVFPMAFPLLIQAELRLPARFLQSGDMDDIERQLQAYGLLPVQARERRWRMDPEAPGGYILTFTLTLPEEP